MKFMKLGIKKRLRFLLIAAIPLFICITAFVWYMLVTHPVLKETKETLYAYQNSTGVNYKVNLKTNPIYDSQSSGEGSVYISNFVDSIDAAFNYKFTGEKNAHIEGEYEIIGVMEGYTGEKDSYKTIWKKQYVLLPREKFTAESSIAEINEKVAIKYADYINLKTTILQNLKFNMPVKLTVSMNVYINTTTDFGKINKTAAASISFPLKDDYFEIAKTEAKDKPESLQEIKQDGIVADSSMNAGFISVLVLLSLALAYILFFTSGVETAAVEKKLDKIFKNHGKRLVALSTGKPKDIEICFKVRDIDDLVRTADELGKPILYTYKLDSENVTEFYVIDCNQLYVYDVTEEQEDTPVNPQGQSEAEIKEKQ